MRRFLLSGKKYFDRANVLAWFQRYTKNSEDTEIDLEGVQRFSTDLGLQLYDPVMLSILRDMNVVCVDTIQRDQWLKGLYKLKCDMIEKVLAKKEKIQSRLRYHNDKYAVFCFAFLISTNEVTKGISPSKAIEILKAFFKTRWNLCFELVTFLEKYKKNLTQEEWSSIYEFYRATTDKKTYNTIDETYEFVAFLWYRRRRSDSANSSSSDFSWHTSFDSNSTVDDLPTTSTGVVSETNPLSTDNFCDSILVQAGISIYTDIENMPSTSRGVISAENLKKLLHDKQPRGDIANIGEGSDTFSHYNRSDFHLYQPIASNVHISDGTGAFSFFNRPSASSTNLRSGSETYVEYDLPSANRDTETCDTAMNTINTGKQSRTEEDAEETSNIENSPKAKRIRFSEH